MEKNKLHWLVGFYEGEGGVYVTRQRIVNKYKKLDGTITPIVYYSPRLELSITQKGRQILDEIKSWLGYGSVCYGHGDDVYKYCCAYKGAEKFIRLVYPYLRSKHKKQQMKKAITLWNKRRHKNGNTIV